MLNPGSMIDGKLRVDHVLGRGAMGTVVAATHVALGRRVAVKVLHPERIDEPDVVARFLREARACVRLQCDHICKVLDIGTTDDRVPYIEMELLEGSDLAELIQHAPLPIATAVDYALQVCVAVAEAHQHGIVHRDLKPSNLYVTRRPDGSALIKVLDFGIATAPPSVGATSDPKLTQTATMLGSPAYMSPEQLRSPRDVDGRSDIWSLGVILYELVTAALPFVSDSLAALAYRVLTEPPEFAPLANIDPRYVAIVMRCLDKDPSRRYQTVAHLASDLATLGDDDALESAALVNRVVSASAIRAVEPPHIAADWRSRTTLGSASGSARSSSGDRLQRSSIAFAAGALLLALVFWGTVLRPHDTQGPDLAALEAGEPDVDNPTARTQSEITPAKTPTRIQPARPRDPKPRPTPLIATPTSAPVTSPAPAPTTARHKVTRDPDPFDDIQPDLDTMRGALANEQWDDTASSAKRVLKLQPDNKEAAKALGKAECHLRMPRFARRTIGVFSKSVRTCGS